jgi:hypothetical protein
VNDLWDWNRGRLILYYSGNHVWGQSGTDNNGNIRFAETWIPPENATLDQATTLSEDNEEATPIRVGGRGGAGVQDTLRVMREQTANVAAGVCWL